MAAVYQDGGDCWSSTALAAALLAAACGGTSAKAADGGADAFVAAVDSAPADAPLPSRSALSFVFARNGQSTFVQFRSEPEGPDSCLVELISGCRVISCELGSPELPWPHAGTITIDSSSTDQTLTPNSDGTYGPAMGGPPAWSGGEPVRITATGGEVPAFDETFAGPANPDEILEPDFSQALVPISMNAPLEARWSGGSGFANLVVGCNQVGLQQQVQIRCPFPAEAGVGSMSVDVLARATDCETAFVALFTEDRREVAVGAGFVLQMGARGIETVRSAQLQ
jgi:hypothetical protein